MSSAAVVISALRIYLMLHSERPKLYAILAFLSAVGLSCGEALDFLHIFLWHMVQFLIAFSVFI